MARNWTWEDGAGEPKILKAEKGSGQQALSNHLVCLEE